VHNIGLLHCRQRKTEPRPLVTHTENLVKFGHVVFPICDYERSDLQTLLGSAGPSLQLGTETVAASDQVRVVGVTLTSDLCPDKHVAMRVCATCFYWLRQLRRVRRSLDAESSATLVHTFVTSFMDYCCAILAGASKS